MPHFSANLSLLFKEYPLIERFAVAKQAGFDAVEIQFPYELSIAEIKQQLDQHDLNLVLINVPAGDLMQGVMVWLVSPLKNKLLEWRSWKHCVMPMN